MMTHGRKCGKLHISRLKVIFAILVLILIGGIAAILGIKNEFLSPMRSLASGEGKAEIDYEPCEPTDDGSDDGDLDSGYFHFDTMIAADVDAWSTRGSCQEDKLTKLTSNDAIASVKTLELIRGEQVKLRRITGGIAYAYAFTDEIIGSMEEIENLTWYGLTSYQRWGNILKEPGKSSLELKEDTTRYLYVKVASSMHKLSTDASYVFCVGLTLAEASENNCITRNLSNTSDTSLQADAGDTIELSVPEADKSARLLYSYGKSFTIQPVNKDSTMAILDSYYTYTKAEGAKRHAERYKNTKDKYYFIRGDEDASLDDDKNYFRIKDERVVGRTSWFYVPSYVKYIDPALINNQEVTIGKDENAATSLPVQETIPSSFLTDKTFTVYYATLQDKVAEPDIYRNPSEVKFTTYTLRAQEKINPIKIVPETTEKGGSEDAIKSIPMDSTIKLLSGTEDCEIFYSFGQSTPLIITQRGEDGKYTTAPGNSDTYKYNDNGIVVTNQNAEYGNKCYITVMAVKYNEDGYRTKIDSAPQTFVFNINEQYAMANVTSVPVTTPEKLAEVRPKDKIILYCETAGVSIFYTLDGTEPQIDEEGNPKSEQTRLYNGAEGIEVPEAVDTIFTVTAIAFRKGYSTSAIARLTFQYPGAVSAPYATPASSTVTENTQVVLKSATEKAVIYYEVGYGGSVPKDPSTASSVYVEGSPIVITNQTVIKAMSSLDGVTSSVNTFTYNLAGKLSVPTPSIASGSVVSKGTVVTLTGSAGGTIYYTTDGSAPNDPANTKVMVGSTVILDGEPGSVITLKTSAMGNNLSSSEVAAFSYTISSFEGGVFADVVTDSTVKSGSNIILNTDVTNGVIYYTTDGTMPTTASKTGSVVTVTGEPGGKFNLKAMALSSGSTQGSGAATFSYQLMKKLKNVQSEVPDGACFTASQAVALSAEMGTIYYTTDGTPPTTASTHYTEAITVDKAMTIQAMAVLEGYDDSEISTFSYSFADKVARPTANLESGEVAIDTELKLTCSTPGTTIYYTTNGTDPSLDDRDYLYPYTEPIKINEAATYKVLAMKENMVDSDVLTLRYTVKEPVVIEGDTEAGAGSTDVGTSGRLKSRRTFSDTSGPSYTEVVLKNATYGAVVSAGYEVLPENVQFSIEKVQTTDTSRNLIKQRLGEDYDIVVSYEAALLSDGVKTQPNGEIEIGIPIPAEYENSMISIVNTQEDGTVEIYETRRSNGMAYAKAENLTSVYAIAAPVITETQSNHTVLIILMVAAGIALVGIGIVLVRRSGKEDTEWEEF